MVGNFLRNPESFDHRFFKKSSREALAWDPQQRVLFDVVYEALESSGYFGPSLSIFFSLPGISFHNAPRTKIPVSDIIDGKNIIDLKLSKGACGGGSAHALSNNLLMRMHPA
jgi:hypothetical protein